MTINHLFLSRGLSVRRVASRKLMILMLNLALAACFCAMPDNAGYGAARDDDGALVPEGPVAEAAKPKREPPVEADDEDLLDAISPGSKKLGGEDVDHLERAIHGMWNAKKRVSGSDTGRQTQEIQNQVVK